MSTNNPMSNIPPLGPPTGMMPGGGSSKFKPIDPMRVLRANWLWIAIAVVFGVGVGAVSWFMLNTFVPRHTSEAQFEVEAENLDATGRSTGPVRMTELEPLINSEVAKIKDQPILRVVVNQPSVQQTSWFGYFNNDLEAAVEDLEENVLGASAIRDTRLFVARASTKKPDDAQIILTALRDEYMRRTNSEVQRQADLDLQAATRRLNAAEQAITGINASIKRFLTNTPIETLREDSSEAAIQVGQLVVKRNELQESYNSLEATYNQLLEREKEGQFDPSDEEREQIELSQEIVAIDSNLRALRIEKQAMLRKFGPLHEVVLNLDERILATERERKQEFDEKARILFDAKLERAALGQQILQQELAKANEALEEWTIKRQENVRLMQSYDTLQRELEAAEVERENARKSIQDLIELANTEARVTVKESFPPQAAKQTFPPEPYLMIPGMTLLVAGLVTGLIFLRELMDQRVLSAADVKLIPDASLVGMIPSANQDRSGNRGGVERVVEQQPAGLLAESFRQVRTAVLSKMDRRGYKTLMLLSAKPDAGVTAIAQNLGASCALSGRRVLIIDANFRRPGMARLMGVTERPGLADLLNGSFGVDKASELVQASSTQNLSVLPAGNTENAAVELFENPRFRELMAKLETEYDLLIIDAPPALLTSDAQLLSRHVDAMLLVSRARSDTRGMLQRMYRELDGQRADILGIVLNGVQAAAGGYLKRNFKEFHAYSGPERRKSTRPAAPAPQAVAAAAEVNGSNGRAEAPAPMSLEADDTPEDDDILGGFDLDDKEEDK